MSLCRTGANGSSDLFTDFTYAAIGVPRNTEIPANADPSYYDMGICDRSDHPLPASAQSCGLFKTPTLRNVATRTVFFHNGKLKSLREVLDFYNTRDTQPELWYPVVNGIAQKFDDLPAQYQLNIDTQAPLDGRAAGSQPSMTAQDLDELEAFTRTFDGRRSGESAELGARHSRARTRNERVSDANAATAHAPDH